MLSSDHGGGDDSDDYFALEWRIHDSRTGKRISVFFGSSLDPKGVQSVEFSRDSKELIAKDGKGKIIERNDFKALIKDAKWY